MRRGLTVTMEPESNFVRVRIYRLDFEECNELCADWSSALHLARSKLSQALNEYNRGAD